MPGGHAGRPGVVSILGTVWFIGGNKASTSESKVFENRPYLTPNANSDGRVVSIYDKNGTWIAGPDFGMESKNLMAEPISETEFMAFGGQVCVLIR